jgi:hypothetical protein
MSATHLGAGLCRRSIPFSSFPAVRGVDQIIAGIAEVLDPLLLGHYPVAITRLQD